ncbi:MAG TPA: glycosyltransferase family 39 protein [Candidatus Goldiibacteriota bacterium]|nr:glycosyltransferase family 39 protein [Candidatus Goldiibacteriota bacterium]
MINTKNLDKRGLALLISPVMAALFLILYAFVFRNSVTLILGILSLNVFAALLLFKTGKPALNIPKIEVKGVKNTLLVYLAVFIIILLSFDLYHAGHYVMTAIIFAAGLPVFFIYTSRKTDALENVVFDGEGNLKKTSVLSAVLFVCAFICLFLSVEAFKTDHIRTGFILFVFSALISLRHFKLFAADAKPGNAFEKSTVKDYIFAGFLVLIAFLIRIYRVVDLPGGLADDEFLMLHFSRLAYTGAKYPAYFAEPTVNQGSLIFYIQAFFYKIFGPTVFTSRLVPVIANSINVFFVYFLVKRLINRRVAVLSSIILTFMFVDILCARINISFSLVVFFALISFLCFLKGEDTKKYIWFILAGLAVGINLQLYNAAKLLPLFYLALLFYRLSFRTERKEVQKLKVHYFVFFVAAIVGFLPVLVFAIKNPNAYFMRVSNTNILGRIAVDLNVLFQFLMNNSLEYFHLMISKGGLTEHWIGKPIFDPFTSVLFMGGLAFLVTRVANPRLSFILVWFIIGMLGGCLSVIETGTMVYRIVLAMPCFAILAGIGLDQILKTADYIKNRKISIFSAFAVAACLLFFIIFININNYFSVNANDPINSLKRRAPLAKLSDVFSKLEIKEVTISEFFSDPKYISMINSFFGDKKINVRSINAEVLDIPRINRTSDKFYALIGEEHFNKYFGIYGEYYEGVNIKRDWNYHYLLVNEKSTYKNSVNLGFRREDVLRYILGKGCPVYFDCNSMRMNYMYCLIPKESIEKSNSLAAVFYGNGSKIRGFESSKNPISLPSNASEARLKGLIYIPDYDTYSFGATGSSSAIVYIDGIRADTQRKLYRGLHRYSASITKKEGATPALTWKKGLGQYEAIPAEYFLNSDKLFGLQADFYGPKGLVYSQLDSVPLKRMYKDENSIYLRFPDLTRFTWKGNIEILESGKYTFKIENKNDCVLNIDGRAVYSKKGDAETFNEISLGRGKHALSADIKMQPTYFYEPVAIKMKQEGKSLFMQPDFSYFKR